MILKNQNIDANKLTYQLEALGYGSQDGGFNFSVVAHLMAGIIPILFHGNSEQKAFFLDNGLNGKTILANAMTEKESGSDVFSMSSKADGTPSAYIVSSNKNYVSNAPVADTILLYVKTDIEKGFVGGISCLMIDKNTHFKSPSAIPKMGLRTCLMGEISLEKVMVDKNRLLGKEGNGGMLFLQSMEWEKLGMAAMHVGTMMRVSEFCKKYIKQRSIADTNMASLLNIRHTLAEMVIKTMAARQMVHHLAMKMGKNKKVALEAAAVKVFVSETLQEVINAAIQIVGGAAFHESHELARAFRDAAAAPIYSGTNDIQKNIIAAYLGIR